MCYIFPIHFTQWQYIVIYLIIYFCQNSYLSWFQYTVFLCILPALGFTTPWDFTRISIRICHFNPPWYLTRTWNLTRTITNDESKISGNTDWTPCFIRHSNGFHYCKKYAKPIYNCSWELMILNTPFIHDFSTNRRKKIESFLIWNIP